MSDIERFITEQAHEFNEMEPAEGHFDRFEHRLDHLNRRQHSHSPVKFWMKIAAGLVLLVAATVVFIGLSSRNLNDSTGMYKSFAGLPDEITEILCLYNSRSTAQMNELKALAQSCPQSTQLIQQTRAKVESMDKEMVNLISIAKTQPANNQVQIALIQQCKAKEIILNNAILQGNMQHCQGN